jgi:hypothetical protein
LRNQLFNPDADKQALEALIIEAQEKHNAAVEGNEVGQYPEGSKAKLQAEIDQAKIVLENPESSISEMKSTIEVLKNA